MGGTISPMTEGFRMGVTIPPMGEGFLGEKTEYQGSGMAEIGWGCTISPTTEGFRVGVTITPMREGFLGCGWRGGDMVLVKTERSLFRL